MCCRLPFRLHLMQTGSTSVIDVAQFLQLLYPFCASFVLPRFWGTGGKQSSCLYRKLFPGSVIVISIVPKSLIIFRNIILGKKQSSHLFSEQLAVFAKRIIGVKNMCKPASMLFCSALVECGKMRCKSNCRSCQSVDLRWPLIILARLEFITLPGPRCHNRLTEKP